MGLFGRKKYSFDEAFAPYQRAPGDNTYDLPQDPVAPLASQYQPGFWQGGDHFSGRDAIAAILAAVSDGLLRQYGGDGGAVQGLTGGRLSAIAMAKKKAEQDAQTRKAFAALTAAGYSPQQAQAMALGVLNPSDVKPDRMMTKSGDIVAFGPNGAPQTAYTETAPELLPVQGQGVYAMDRHTGRSYAPPGMTPMSPEEIQAMGLHPQGPGGAGPQTPRTFPPRRRRY